MICVLAETWPITWTVIGWTPDPPPKKISIWVYIWLHIYANLWVKILKFGGVKKMDNFLTSLKSSKSGTFWPSKWPISDLFKNPNWICKVPFGTPMDWSLMKSVNAEYPLNCCKYGPAHSKPCQTPQVCHTPSSKMVPPYSLGTCPTKTPKALWSPIAPSLRKKLIF